MNPGGKGANQAVAVARLGGDVAFIGKIGDDIFSKQSSQLFDEEGVEIGGIIADEGAPAAGDVFNGALEVAVEEGKTLKDAVSFACQASAIAVKRMGARYSIPYRREIVYGE
ncbi:pfkB family carbohydrate kinase [bacterium A37T11]|nr:pfkB family carbohydrate kinase [bacterium A37T11]